MNRYKGRLTRWDGKECPLAYSRRMVARHKKQRETLNQRLLREQRERELENEKSIHCGRE